MAEKLIPGIAHATRIAILQQTDDDKGLGGNVSLKLEKTVLESVLGSDEARNEAVQLADGKPIFEPYGRYANKNQSFPKASRPTTRWHQYMRFVKFVTTKRRRNYSWHRKIPA